MPRKLNSFMIRWWHGEDAERLELEHVQSGRKALTSSLEDAVAWLEEQQSADPGSVAGEYTVDQGAPEDGGEQPETLHRRFP